MNATLATPLTAADRCDRCGAQAYVRVVLESTGGELLFCAHHARANEEKLRPLAATWQDETQHIGAEESERPCAHRPRDHSREVQDTEAGEGQARRGAGR